MKREDIIDLKQAGVFPCDCTDPPLVETHISWIIMCLKYVFKIKKPVRYSFLDFSTLDKRKYYCQQEVALNRRLAPKIYLGIVSIKKDAKHWEVAKDLGGEVKEYAVWMRRMDNRKRMDLMLENHAVTPLQIKKIATILARFHRQAPQYRTVDPLTVHYDFMDIRSEQDFIRRQFGKRMQGLLDRALKRSEDFVRSFHDLLKQRICQGFVRDCHGDLHSRNIILESSPIIFDCIEFNPQVRRIDILNELAFFCMDLESLGHSDLGRVFITFYNDLLKVIRCADDKKLFVYYKAYRANVRAKVNILQMKSAKREMAGKLKQECLQYLQLMHQYMDCLP